MPDPNEERLKYLFNATAIEVPKAEEGQKRKFKGTAYAGGRVDGHWYWGRSGVVFDLDGIEIDKPTALLEEHFGSSRIGVVQAVDTNGKIDVSGDFLTNAKAQEIVQDSDDGFPFQMSMMIDPGSIEEVSQGKTVTVNGQLFEGPITIFRQNRIREFTICSTGADRNTSIKAFSGKANPNPTKEDTDVDLEQAKAKIQELETENSELKTQVQQFSAKAREAEITALTAETKTVFSAEEVTEMKALDDKSFAFSAAQIRKFSANSAPKKPDLPDYLTKHQAGGDQNQFNAKPMSLADQAKARK
ncbi:MAG: hypothetical protein VB979_00150 [Acinetobacter sp.]|uniref:hypothetical protein n=1 Tax=Acinetobacter sp. TaxID=472 RepID=UPI003981D79D